MHWISMTPTCRRFCIRPHRCTPRARRWPSGAGSRGIDLLAAHALGYELAARASNALYPEHYDAGWHMTGTTGALASAAVAIRLLGLTGATATHCLSIAATQAAGHREQFGTMTKPFHAGHAAQAGVWAGLLAAGGFTGAPDPLQGRRGMFAVMSSASTPADLVDGLGRAVADLRQRGQAVRVRRGDPPGRSTRSATSPCARA